MNLLPLILSICFLFLIVSSPDAKASDNGIFMVVKGTVKLISGNGNNTDKKETLAKVGTKVFSGDTVITEADSRAKIVMADRNVLQLSPNSRFEITKYKTGAIEDQRAAQVALMQGKVRVQVEQKYGEKNKFELRTPTAVAGVRGTQYVAQFEPSSQTTTIVVLTGKVAVSTSRQNSAPVVLTPNMGSTIKEDTTKIEPVHLSSEQIKGLTSEQPISKKEAPQDSTSAPSSGSGKESSESNTKDTSPSSGAQIATPSPSTAPEKSLVTTDIIGSEVLVKDPKLQSTMQQTPSSPGSNAPSVPTVPIPKPPTTNPLVNEVIQNKNSKTKVIVNPRPQP